MDKSKIRKIKKYSVVLIVNLALTLILLESGSLIHYWFTSGRFFYTRDLPAPSQADPEVDTILTPYRLSPYFGYVRAPHQGIKRFVSDQRLTRQAWPVISPAWHRVQTNNHGFLSPYDYPVQRISSNQFFIAIVGGSVAQFFALQGLQTLISELQSSPQYRNLDIVVLNLAGAGYKQPQQLNIINYYLAIGQPIDLVINIDGFNEVALGKLNREYGYDPAMPNAHQLDRLSQLVLVSGNEEDFLSTARLVGLRKDLREIAQRESKCAFAICSLFLNAKCAWLTGLIEQLDSASLHAGPNPQKSLLCIYNSADSASAAKELIEVEIWRRSSLQLYGTLSALSIGYLHVVQPNQYYSGHPFTLEESKISLKRDSQFAEAVQELYPEIERAAVSLAQANYPIANAMHIFDQVTDPVFADACCHYNQRGNEFLARYIAAQLLSTTSLDP